MDTVQQIVDELKAEKARIAKALAILTNENGDDRPARKPAASAATSIRRGSSWTQTEEARQAQSRRAKAYWRNWRKANKRTAA